MCRRRRPGFRRADNLPRLPDAAAVRHRSGPAPSAPTLLAPMPPAPLVPRPAPRHPSWDPLRHPAPGTHPPRSTFPVETDGHACRFRPERAEWPPPVIVPALDRLR